MVLLVRNTILVASSVALFSIKASSDQSFGTKPYTNCISSAWAISLSDLMVVML